MEGTESVAEPLPAAPVEESESLSDHEASFGRGGTGAPPDDDDPGAESVDAGERDDKGRFRHHAASQKATPDDVQQINTLTRELRQKERELGKARPESIAGSPRLVALRQRIKAIDAELGELKPVVTPAAVAPAAQAPRTPTTFTDVEPTIEQFADKDDPYSALLRGQSAYDRKKERWEESQATAVSQQAETQRAQQQQSYQTYHTRVTEFLKTTPDFTSVVSAADDGRPLPPVLEKAVVTADNGPALLYAMVKDTPFFDEMCLLTEGRAPSDPLVAIAQRRLLQHAQAAQTGSAAVTRISHQAPRPPNPVRTGPIRTGDDLPGDGSSLADHEKAFGPKRRR